MYFNNSAMMVRDIQLERCKLVARIRVLGKFDVATIINLHRCMPNLIERQAKWYHLLSTPLAL